MSYGHLVEHDHHWCIRVTVGVSSTPQYEKCCICGRERWNPKPAPDRGDVR